MYYKPGCPSPTDSEVKRKVSPSFISRTPVFPDPFAWAGILFWKKNIYQILMNSDEIAQIFLRQFLKFLKCVIYPIHFLMKFDKLLLRCCLFYKTTPLSAKANIIILSINAWLTIDTQMFLPNNEKIRENLFAFTPKNSFVKLKWFT